MVEIGNQKRTKTRTWHGRCSRSDSEKWQSNQARIAALEVQLENLRVRLEAVVVERDEILRQLLTPGLSEEEREALRELWAKRPRRGQKNAGESAG